MVDTSDLKITDAAPDAAPSPAAEPDPVQTAKPDKPTPPVVAFEPIVPPPSDHHALNTGLGTEHGDSPKTLVEKVNAGFANVISMLEGLGAKPVSAVESEVKMVSQEAFDELKAAHDAMAARFEALAEHIEVALGLKK